MSNLELAERFNHRRCEIFLDPADHGAIQYDRVAAGVWLTRHSIHWSNTYQREKLFYSNASHLREKKVIHF